MSSALTGMYNNRQTNEHYVNVARQQHISDDDNNYDDDNADDDDDEYPFPVISNL